LVAVHPSSPTRTITPLHRGLTLTELLVTITVIAALASLAVPAWAAGNCLVPFFLREGKPTFIRIFETP